MTEASEPKAPSTAETAARTGLLTNLQLVATFALLGAVLALSFFPHPWVAPLALVVATGALLVHAWTAVGRWRLLGDASGLWTAAGFLFLVAFAWLTHRPMTVLGVPGILVALPCMLAFMALAGIGFFISDRRLRAADVELRESLAAFRQELDRKGLSGGTEVDPVDGGLVPSRAGGPGGSAEEHRERDAGGPGGPGGAQ